jgi:hypothetical protein
MGFLEEVTHWRSRAEHARVKANESADASFRQRMLKMAADCDDLANAADARRVAIARQTLRAREHAAAARRAEAEAYATKVLPIIREVQQDGARSLREIAQALTARGAQTQRGGRWHAISVKNVPDRASIRQLQPVLGNRNSPPQSSGPANNPALAP